MKNRGLFILIIFAVLSVSAPSEAVNWLYIGGREGISLHVDTDTVTEAADGVKEAWFMLQYNPPDCTSDYAKRLNKCVTNYTTLEWHYSNRTLCMYGFVHYFTDGTNTGFRTVSCQPQKVIPGSLGEMKWKYLYR